MRDEKSNIKTILKTLRQVLSPRAQRDHWHGRYEELGAEGFHSLYRWYQRFEAQHFPDPAGLRDTIARYTLHLYPGVVQAAMALFDVPEAIAVTRTAMCSATAAPLSRFQVRMATLYQQADDVHVLTNGQSEGAGHSMQLKGQAFMMQILAFTHFHLRKSEVCQKVQSVNGAVTVQSYHSRRTAIDRSARERLIAAECTML